MNLYQVSVNSARLCKILAESSFHAIELAKTKNPTIPKHNREYVWTAKRIYL